MLSTQVCLESRGNLDLHGGSALQAVWECHHCQLCDLGQGLSLSTGVITIIRRR